MAETGSSAQVRVLVVEDDFETRKYIEESLHDNEQRYVVSGAATLAEGLARLESDPPDFLLVDLGLPDGNGIDLIRRGRELTADLLVLVISVFGDEQSLVGALEAGARGYLLKSEEPADIREAVQQILDGGAPISPGIASHLLRRFAGDGKDTSEQQPQTPLTKRERRVLELVVRGLTHQESADILGVTRNTVASHVKHIYRKLEVQSRGEATFEAIRQGLVQVDRETE